MARIKEILLKAWASPTITTWASLGARTLSLVLVLPLVLRRFSTEETAVWQLFSTIISLQIFVDLGFTPTFTRLLAYAMGGAANLNEASNQTSKKLGKQEPNWTLLEQVAGTMRYIYSRMAFASFLLIGGIGTCALAAPVRAIHENAALAASGSQGKAWVAWGILLCVTAISFGFTTYGSFVQGTNHVALARRWEAIFGIASIASSVVVLWFGGGLLALTLSTQFWVLISGFRNKWLSGTILNGRFRTFPKGEMITDIFKVAWPASWRSAIGAGMSVGVVQGGALIYAQSDNVVAVSSYLLGLRLITGIAQVSMAPFYSKLPLFAQLHSQGNHEQLLAAASRGMKLSYWVFVIPFVLLGVCGQPLLTRIHSQTPFPDPKLWVLLGLYALLERYGAMHLQLFSTGNRIVWHIANGMTGAASIAFAALAYPKMGIVALPLGLLIGTAFLYVPYSVSLSHKFLSIRFPLFDGPLFGPPLLISLGIAFYVLVQ